VLQNVSVGIEVAYQPNYSVPLADASTAAATAAFNADPIGFTGTATDPGFTRANRTQTILNAIYIAPPTTPILGTFIQAAGMDDMTIMAETAWTHFDEKPFNTFGDKNAVGYVLDVTGSYQGIFGTPWVLYPGFAFKHDVKGTALDYVVTDTHIAGRKTLTLRLTADYQSTWSVGVAYVNNFGAGNMNFNSDRDYVSATVSYAF
jgi:hypothetical protein